MEVTSFAILSLKPGKRPEDVDSAAGKVMQGRLSDILKAPGAQRCYWGLAIEHPDLLYLIVDWDTLQHHIDFANQPHDATSDLAQLCNGAPTVYHAALSPSPPRRTLSKAHSPVVEIVTISFPANLPQASQNTVTADIRKFRDVLESPGGCNASAGGWVLEDMLIPGSDEKGKAFVMMFGWDSVEAHSAFVKTPVVQEHVHLIAGLGQSSLDMCHVSLAEVDRQMAQPSMG